jgi:hypothetical protein
MAKHGDTPRPELNVTLSAREMRELREQQRNDWKRYREQLRRDRDHLRGNDPLAGLLPDLREPEWLREIRKTVEGANTRFVKWLNDTREERDRIAGNIVRFLREDLAPIAQKAVEALSTKLAPNWIGLTVDELEGATALAKEKGLCVVWAPRQEIVRALLAAETDADLETVLSEHVDEILADVEAVLDEATHPDIAEHRTLALEVIADFRDGRPASAQALAGTVVTNVVTVLFGTSFGDFWKRWEEVEPEDASLGEFRMRVILFSLARTVHHTDYAVPGWNRHVAIGHAGLTDLTDATLALQAVMLVGAVVRELHAVYTLLDEADETDSAGEADTTG